MSECKFCQGLESWKRAAMFPPQYDERLGKLKNEYTVAIVIHRWYAKRGKRSSGRTTDYRYRGLGYKLNYCPECGKELKRRRQT